MHSQRWICAHIRTYRGMIPRNARFRVSLYYRSNTNASCTNIPDVNQTNWTYTARYNNLFSTFSEVRDTRGMKAIRIRDIEVQSWFFSWYKNLWENYLIEYQTYVTYVWQMIRHFISKVANMIYTYIYFLPFSVFFFSCYNLTIRWVSWWVAGTGLIQRDLFDIIRSYRRELRMEVTRQQVPCSTLCFWFFEIFQACSEYTYGAGGGRIHIRGFRWKKMAEQRGEHPRARWELG